MTDELAINFSASLWEWLESDEKIMAAVVAEGLRRGHLIPPADELREMVIESLADHGILEAGGVKFDLLPFTEALRRRLLERDR